MQCFSTAAEALAYQRQYPTLTVFYLNRVTYPNTAQRWVVAPALTYPYDCVALMPLEVAR